MAMTHLPPKPLGSPPASTMAGSGARSVAPLPSRRAVLGLSLAAAPLGLLGCGGRASPRGGAASGAGSGAPVAAPSAPLSTVVLDGVPHVRQRPDFCGEADVEMVLRALGQRHTQDDVFALTGLSPELGRGAYTKELKLAVERLGFEPGAVWHPVPRDPDGRASRAALDAALAALHHDLAQGVPSIVCTRFDESKGASEHFRLVIGYDAERDEVVYHDPALDQGARLRMPRARFYEAWPLYYEPSRATLVRFSMRTRGTPPPPVRPAGFSPADYAQAVMAVREKLAPGQSVVIEPPFVVAGDGDEARVRARAEGTVRFAVSRLKKAFFDKDPTRILTIWLFEGAASYRRHAVRLFREEPSTPYGYYSSTHGALVMDISTGGGTLVHEIVHPFVEANVPNCPAWLNEGLGSLFEQSADRGGEIVGLTNWRLAGLQRAIKAKALPRFEALMRTTSHAFYEDDPGTHYAQARYLMYYLQEQGLLKKYYRGYLADRLTDETGVTTLRAVLGERDLVAFQTRWERWALTLRYP